MARAAAHIMENNHRSDDAACPVVDRRRRIFNGGFKSVAADEDAIHSQSHRLIFLDGHLHGVSSGLAGGAVNNAEDFGEGFASGFFAAPPGHGLCNEIEIGDVAGNVGAQNGVTNRVQGDHGAFFFQVQRILHSLAFDSVVQCARQGITVEVTRQEIILRTASHSLFREGFVTVAEDQNWDVGHAGEQLVERLDTVTIGQGQLEQDSVNSFFAQACKTLGKLENPFQFERSAASCG